MKRVRGLILLAVLSCAPPAHAQERIALGPSFCNADPGAEPAGEVTVSDAGPEAEAMVARIVGFAGLPQNFTIKSYDRFNAQAHILDRKRIIFYNPQYLKSLAEVAGTDRAAIGVMAHEVAHHLLGHTVEHERSNPKLEEEADEYAGFIMGKMGFSLDEAQSGFKVVSSELVRPGSTHPKRSERLAAVERGWAKARSLPDPGRTPPVVPENLVEPFRRVVEGMRDGFQNLRGPALVTSSPYAAYKSSLTPPPLQSWEIYIRQTGDSWVWRASRRGSTDRQEAESTFNAIRAAVQSVVPAGWLLSMPYGNYEWREPATGAVIGARKFDDGTIELEFIARVYAASPAEPEYRARLRAIVEAARNGFRGLTEARLKDRGSGLLPHDAYPEIAPDILLDRNTGSRAVRLHWSTEHEQRHLARARYDMIVRAVTETFPDFAETQSDSENAQTFRGGRVEITVGLKTYGGLSWVDVDIWDRGRE